jgi:hypothetical protein
LPPLQDAQYISDTSLGTWQIQIYRFNPIPLSISPLKGEKKGFLPFRGGLRWGWVRSEKQYNDIF